jgi:hypothetical protein
MLAAITLAEQNATSTILARKLSAESNAGLARELSDPKLAPAAPSLASYGVSVAVVCTKNLVRVDHVMELLILAE